MSDATWVDEPTPEQLVDRFLASDHDDRLRFMAVVVAHHRAAVECAAGAHEATLESYDRQVEDLTKRSQKLARRAARMEAAEIQALQHCMHAQMAEHVAESQARYWRERSDLAIDLWRDAKAELESRAGGS